MHLVVEDNRIEELNLFLGVLVVNHKRILLLNVADDAALNFIIGLLAIVNENNVLLFAKLELVD